MASDGRREFLRLGAGAAAAAALTGAPRVLSAQGKGKVKLAYLQLGWAATEIIHKEDLTDGMLSAMKTTIDAAGRLVIPKEVREEAGLRPGMDLDVRCRSGRIEIEPAPLPVKLVRKGRLLVAVPQRKVEKLSAEAVEATRRTLRRERAARR